MKPYVTDDPRNGPKDPSYLYDLVAVTEHYGWSLAAGHYKAKVLDRTTGQWYVCNDADKPQACAKAHVKTSNAYILYYVRRSAPGLMAFQDWWTPPK
ncbi:Ubiquitin carboxyl-terminal hydrolase 49 [Blyttiomyces sp. JEL0837]|nr:Ubiquitin carboxyl-terminal hydrolase 49 [Blyttiomyces sp. JEL0837]